MPGGILQLAASASQDQYVTGSPEMSYFKAVYKKHTNFAMESIKQTFLSRPFLSSSTSTVTCRIGRNADLLGEIYFVCDLPAIYSDNDARFRWVKNVGQYMIYSYSIRLDTQLIDQGYGEWMDVWNELTAAQNKKEVYNSMIGNNDEMINPIANLPRVVVKNNTFTYEFYPVATPDTPSIKQQRIVVPLPFWFTKNPSLALPLVALQYQFIEISLEMRPIEDLYQVYDSINQVYVSPSRYQQIFPSRTGVGIGRFLTYNGDSGSVPIDINGFLECNFYFLDNTERRTISSQQIDLLVERVYRTEIGNTATNNVIDMYISNPVKEFVWFARPDDIKNTNEWTKFVYQNNPIMNTAKIMWNGLDRIEEKDEYYYNKIQTYQHHSNSVRDGLYCYCFSLFPEKWQPSGSFNASAVNRIQLYTTVNTAATGVGYVFTVYTLYYNVFRVIGGNGGMVFAN
jgi:hypothetical protein